MHLRSNLSSDLMLKLGAALHRDVALVQQLRCLRFGVLLVLQLLLLLLQLHQLPLLLPQHLHLLPMLLLHSSHAAAQLLLHHGRSRLAADVAASCAHCRRARWAAPPRANRPPTLPHCPPYDFILILAPVTPH